MLGAIAMRSGLMAGSRFPKAYGFLTMGEAATGAGGRWGWTDRPNVFPMRWLVAARLNSEISFEGRVAIRSDSKRGSRRDLSVVDAAAFNFRVKQS